MDVSQYLEIFIDESAEHLQTLSDCIMELEKEPDNKDVINEIFRAAHSLKGMAGTMGFKRMQHLTHDMENVFQEVRSEKIQVDSQMIDLLFKCLDAIDGYLENIKATSDEGEEDNEVIIKELNNFLAKANGEAAAAEAAPAETEKEAAAPTDNGDHKLYLQIDLTDQERDAVMTAKDSGMHIYGMTVMIQKECLLKAARAFLVFREVEAFGEILVYRPSSQDIEDEKFEQEFSFYVASPESFDKIQNAAKNVSEIEDAVGEELTDFSPRVTETETEEKKEEKPAETKTEVQAAPKKAPEKKKAPAKKNGVGKPATSRTVRVDIEKLDALMNQVSELIIAKNSLVSISSTEEGGFTNQGFHEQIEYLERITTSLHESVMNVRMVPIETVVNRFPRMIRDLSKKLDKKMELYMTGEETELDRTVIDEIGDPLMHLLRNSADHGLESAEVRRERGKDEIGTIFLNAFQDGNNVVIEVGDDGNGIDIEKVKSKAIERGTITPEQAEVMSDKEVIDLLFLPSFSTSEKITDVSGRGVGLDVVKSKIESLGGVVECKSVLGEGSTFTIRLPLTLAIIQALMVKLGNEQYAIALGSIQTIEDIPLSDIKYVQGKEVINLRGNIIPIIRLGELLDVPDRTEPDESLIVVVIKKGDKQAGLVVDSLVGQMEIVIKSLGKYININKMISGATILGDGEVALIIDANAII